MSARLHCVHIYSRIHSLRIRSIILLAARSSARRCIMHGVSVSAIVIVHKSLCLLRYCECLTGNIQDISTPPFLSRTALPPSSSLLTCPSPARTAARSFSSPRVSSLWRITRSRVRWRGRGEARVEERGDGDDRGDGGGGQPGGRRSVAEGVVTAPEAKCDRSRLHNGGARL